MPVQIRLKGNKEANEYKDALALKELLSAEFGDERINGTILIINSATLFGQPVKDVDLIVLGTFEKYSCKVKTRLRTSGGEQAESNEHIVYVNNFCFVIETKRHRPEDVRLSGLNLLVRYNEHYHDVTTQSEAQKYSLRDFLKDRLSFAPYICNFIWFRNVTWPSIKDLLANNEKILTKHNYLPSTFSFKFLLQLACVQQLPFNATDKSTGRQKPFSSFNCLKRDDSFDFAQMQDVFDLFERVKDGTGQLTRRKIEQITSKLLDQQQYAQAIGEKLIIISGRAGTGKTIKLLRISCDLAINRGARCLILTYNHALVSDIKRTLALAEIPDGIDDYTVAISTLHKFIFDLVIGFGIVVDSINPDVDIRFIPDYIRRYDYYLQQLIDYIDAGLIQEKEIQQLMRSKHDLVAWDYVLIDEAQDWGELEKTIIFKIFSPSKTIIADGIDQLIRSQQKCNWSRGMKLDVDFRRTFEKKGLRQQVNLVSFVNGFAEQVGVTWELEPKPELTGGKVVISLKPYSKELHQSELTRCLACGNSHYEMMFLVPPNLVNRGTINDQHGRVVEDRNFKLAAEFGQMGISVWDGTNTDLRTQYAVELDQHRLLQYESCRGLEGWTVVCLELDQFVKYKMASFEDESTGELALGSLEERRNKFVYLWSLIPLTRAIDTLVITIADPDSQICKSLRKVYERNPDFIQWIE